MAYDNFQKSFYRMISGLGVKVFLDPGNTGNPPSDPPVQNGNYQYIQPEMFYTQQGLDAIDYQPIPPAYVAWGQFPLNAADEGGFFGGGEYNGQAVENTQENDLFYDTSNNLYYDLGDT